MKTIGTFLIWSSAVVLYILGILWSYSRWGLLGAALFAVIPPVAELFPFIYLLNDGVTLFLVLLFAIWLAGVVGIVLLGLERVDRNNLLPSSLAVGLSISLCLLCAAIVGIASVYNASLARNGPQTEGQRQSPATSAPIPPENPAYVQTVPSATTALAPPSPSTILGTPVATKYVIVPHSDMAFVCVDLAYAYAEPNTQSSVVYQLSQADNWVVWINGSVDRWLAIESLQQLGRERNPVPYGTAFIYASNLCSETTKAREQKSLCAGYALPNTENILRYSGQMRPIRAITRPNGVKVYFDIADNEYWDRNETGGTIYFDCPAAAEREGFKPGHPK